MGLKNFLAGFLCCALLCGCAGFSYRYYGLDGLDYTHGTLVGDVPANDLPLTTCQPSVTLKNPCIVMKASEFYLMKQDYNDTKQKLKECQKSLELQKSG